MEPVASSSRADLQTGCSLASTSQEITFIESQRGVPIILHAGYEYTKKRENKNSSIVWRCVNRRCHGGMVTSNNNVTKILRHDICTPSIARNDIKEEIHRCKQEAKSSEGKSIPSVFNSSIKKLLDKGTDKIEKLPELSNVKNSLYSARNKAQQIKKATFKTPFEVKIPVSYMSFVLFDYEYRKTRILAFADVNSKGLHQHVKHYLADGTFKCVVKPFRQLYVIYGDLGSTSEKIHVVPLIYILLMDKKEFTYETAFALIKSQIPEWHPITFRTDYEKAAMNAIRNIFPDVICKGCYFHFSQALWKRAKALKLNKKRMFKKHIALCTALALLPPELKCDGWLYIMEDCPKTLNIEKYNDYFVSAWLDNEYYRGKWDFWGDIYRTNNPVEGSNAKLNRTYSGKLNIISFLNVIKNDAVLSLARQELPPEKPTIKAEKGWYASGDSLRAQCSSPPADPPANLTWLLNGRDIQGKPIIQQRILPSPVVSIDAPHTFRSTVTPVDDHNNIIFSPWKAFGPFVDTIQEGELLPSQDTVVLPSPRHHDSSIDEDATDPMPTAETSNKVASISQLSFMVRPDSFERGQLRLTCISTVHSVYSEQAELVINEERPQIASVLGTRDTAGGPVAASLLLLLVSNTFAMWDIIFRNILR